MNTLRAAMFCFAVTAPYLYATTPQPAHPSPSPHAATPQPMTMEQAFYYWVAVYGPSADVVDRYAVVFDAGNYRQAMADEFERARYRNAIDAKIQAHVRALTFDEKYVYLSRLDSQTAARFGEYSFANHAFPVLLPDTGFSYFNYYVAGNGFDINPFDLGKALNVKDFNWSLPMQESAARAFLKSRPDRCLMLRFVYSVTRDKNDVYSLRYYLTPFIHSIAAYDCHSTSDPVGVLFRNAAAPKDPRGGSGSEHARQQQTGIIQLLLECGASPADKDGRGKQVRQAAASEWIRTLLVGGSG